MTRRIGKVSLVGAGPGDPGLITVKGLAALKQADVVIYDHLVSPRLLASCRRDARLIYAGKEHGTHRVSQSTINQWLVRHAKAGRAVVRLKGGDPLLFGRGAEEALVLARAGIPYDIVPGVTSAIAVPAYAGIPVTHRKTASSVAIVTGHEDPDKDERVVDWEHLAQGADTLVCLMGVRTLPQIVRRLIDAGRSKQTPSAVIEWGTYARQRTVTGTLATIVARCLARHLRPPAIVVIGEVAALRPQMNWFESLPLFGRCIAVTRPVDRSAELSDRLEALGAAVIELPAIELAAVKTNGVFRRTIASMPEIDWVFFTSPEGIEWFWRLLKAERKDLRILLGRHIGAIGPKTAESIRALGLHVDFTPRTHTQEGMLEGLKRRRLEGKRAVILGAQQARDVLEQGLKAEGMDVWRVPVYRTVVAPLLRRRVRTLLDQPIDLVTATSSSCVEHLRAALHACGVAESFRQFRFASIGPATSATIRRYGGTVAIEASTSTIEGLVEALVARACMPHRRRAPSRIPAGCSAGQEHGG